MSCVRIDYSEVIDGLTSEIKKIVEEKNLCGLSIALVDDREVIWTKGFGYTDRSRGEPVTADTLFSSQSFCKCLTATAFMIMASKGLINLDDPISKHYPEFSVKTRFGDPEEEIEKITFRKMLSHWAGFTHEALVGNNYTDEPVTFKEHIESISKGWLKSPVGSELSYSNLGYDLTGYIMGLVMNQSYEETMKEVLLQPLGMIAATYKIEEALNQSFARGYFREFAAPVVQIPMLPAGGIYISANDVAKFIQFHLRKGRINDQQVIDPSLFEDMYKPQYPEKKEFGYGLGVYSHQKIGDAKAYGHAGGGYGYQTIMQWVPEYKVGVVVLTNTDLWHNIPGSLAKKSLESMISKKNKPQANPIKPELLERLEGTYNADGNLAPQLIRISCEDSKLIFYAVGSEIELIPQNSTDFLSNNKTKYAFELDKEGFPLAVYVDDPVFPFRAKYNDGPKDKPGSNNPNWQQHIGIYQYTEYGRTSYLALSIINGYLYLTFDDNLKLHHYRDDVYFTADGEALILQKNALNFKGILAQKIDLNIEQVIEAIKLNRYNLDSYYITAKSLANVVNATQGFDEALSFIKRAVDTDNSFKIIYSMLGKRLYAMGKLKEAQECFTRLMTIDSEDKNAAEMLMKIKRKHSSRTRI
ncbi:MAG: beta-lactamase family protein [Candidatus Bathyarchaeota archaeon]|nr:beta-lactamase family protein [Candidatus Bathyarchaeota archaeon]